MEANYDNLLDEIDHALEDYEKELRVRAIRRIRVHQGMVEITDDDIRNESELIEIIDEYITHVTPKDQDVEQMITEWSEEADKTLQDYGYDKLSRELAIWNMTNVPRTTVL